MKRAGLMVLVFLLINLGGDIRSYAHREHDWLAYVFAMTVCTLFTVGALELYHHIRRVGAIKR